MILYWYITNYMLKILDKKLSNGEIIYTAPLVLILMGMVFLMWFTPKELKNSIYERADHFEFDLTKMLRWERNL